MSTEVTVVDEAALKEALAAVRSDAQEEDWCMASHAGKPNEIKLSGKGTGGLTELLDNVEDDNVCYALLRVTEQVDLSTTVKFVYMHFEGPSLSFVKKGRYAIVRGHVTDRLFSPSHVDFTCITDPSEITEAKIMQKVADASGTANKILDSTEGRTERGYLAGRVDMQHEPRFAAGNTATKTPVYKDVKPVNTAKAELQFSDDIKTAIAEIRDDKSSTNWVLTGYEGNSVQKPLVMLEMGTGDIKEFASKFDNGRILYGLCRTNDIYEGITTVKFVYVHWVGDDVPPMQKARSTIHKGACSAHFEPYHVSFEGTSKHEEISESAIKAKIAAASGSKNSVL